MPWQSTEHRDFSGGENLADNPRHLQENQVVLLENGEILGRGQVRRRSGMTEVPDAKEFNDRIDLYTHFLKRDGTSLHMVISGGTLSLEDGTELISGLAGPPYGTEVMADTFLLVDGNEFYRSDGTPEGTEPVPLPGEDDDDATLDEVRRCNLLVEHLSRLYAAGDPHNPHKLYYSQTNRYDYFKEGDMELIVTQDDAEPIRVVQPMFGGLLVGTRTGWWLVDGDPAAEISSRRIISGQGPVSRAHVVVGGELWYLAEDGIRVLRQPENNTYDNPLASYEHGPLLERIVDRDKVIIAYHRNRILVFYQIDPESDGNDFCSMLDLRFRDLFRQRHGAWSRITGWPVSAILYRGDGGLQAGLETGKLVRLFDGDKDLDELIRFRLHTPEYAITEGFMFKLFDGVDIQALHEGTGTSLVVHEQIIGETTVTKILPLLQFRGNISNHFPFRPRVRGLFIQHQLESRSTGRLTVLSVGERWRPTRRLRAHEIETP